MLPELQAISAPVSHLLRVQSGRHQAKQEVISKQQFGKKEHICVWCVLAALLLCKLWCELMNLPRWAVWLPVASELLHKHGFPVLHDDDVDIRMKTEIQSVWLADEWEARLQN